MNWSLALWAGISGGLAMGVWTMLMRYFGFTVLNMPQYLGCLVTGKHEGTRNFLAGVTVHLAFSVLVACIYAWVFEVLWPTATWWSGLVFGVGHWLVGGLMLPALDAVNDCAMSGAIPRLQAFAAMYGEGAVATFLTGHLLFGAIVGWIYEVEPLT